MPFFVFFPPCITPDDDDDDGAHLGQELGPRKTRKKRRRDLYFAYGRFFFLSGTIPSARYPKGRGWRRTRPAGSHLRRRTLPRLRAALLVQARARIAISGMTRTSSSLPLFLPTLPVHPSPTKTRDYSHLNPPLPRTPHSSSWNSSRPCCPKPNNSNNNGPTARPPPPRSPPPHSTPPVLLRPAFPAIRFHGPTMLPPPPPPPRPDPRLGDPAALHPRSSPVGTRQPTPQLTTTSWPHSV